MDDDTISTINKLKEARSEFVNVQHGDKASRQLAIAITHLETAILWAEYDARIRSGEVIDHD